MNYYKKILKIFINSLTTLLLILLAIAVFGKATVVFGNKTYPNYFGYTFFSIASGSMEPSLYVNDVILVKINEKDIKKGDIITYAKNKEIITHRVISINNDSLTVKGDANNTIDDPIESSQVIGKVVKVFPKLSVWQKIITEPKILITMFITFLLFDACLSYKGTENNKETKKEIANQKNIDKQIDTNELPKLSKETGNIDIKMVRKPITKRNSENFAVKNNILKDEEINSHIINSNNDYTVRLDLNAINDIIKSKVK